MRIKLFIVIVLFWVLTTQALGLPSNFSSYIMPGNIQLQVIDPAGNITGYDPITNSVLKNIPNTMYALSIEPDTQVSKYTSHYVAMTQVVSNTRHIETGNYKIKVFAPATIETMNLYFKVFYQNIIGVQIMAQHTSIIYPNVTWTYEITVPDVPPATKNVPLIKVANSQDLITDINAAGSLGYIGNNKFVSELTKEINEIEAEKAKGKVDDGLTPAQKAKKEYTELLKEIAEKYNKPEGDEFVKQEAYSVLKEDLEYIIGHL